MSANENTSVDYYIAPKASFDATADAIRAVTGESGDIEWKSNGFADAVGSIPINPNSINTISEVTLAETYANSLNLVNAILGNTTKETGHMYIVCLTNKNISQYISDQLVAGTYSISGSGTSLGGGGGIRYRNNGIQSMPINSSYDGANEIGDTYILIDVNMWEVQ